MSKLFKPLCVVKKLTRECQNQITKSCESEKHDKPGKIISAVHKSVLTTYLSWFVIFINMIILFSSDGLWDRDRGYGTARYRFQDESTLNTFARLCASLLARILLYHGIYVTSESVRAPRSFTVHHRDHISDEKRHNTGSDPQMNYAVVWMQISVFSHAQSYCLWLSKPFGNVFGPTQLSTSWPGCWCLDWRYLVVQPHHYFIKQERSKLKFVQDTHERWLLRTLHHTSLITTHMY